MEVSPEQQQQPPSLWHRITAIVPLPQQDIIKDAIGSSLIEQNEMLLRETRALQGILASVLADYQRSDSIPQSLHPELLLESGVCESAPAHSLASTGNCTNARTPITGAKVGGQRQAGKDIRSGTTGHRVSGSRIRREEAKGSIRAVKASKPQGSKALGSGTYQEVRKLQSGYSKEANGEEEKNTSHIVGTLGAFGTSCSKSSYFGGSGFDPLSLVKELAPRLNVLDIDEVAGQLQEAFAKEHVNPSHDHQVPFNEYILKVIVFYPPPAQAALQEDARDLSCILDKFADLYSNVKNAYSESETKACCSIYEQFSSNAQAGMPSPLYTRPEGNGKKSQQADAIPADVSSKKQTKKAPVTRLSPLR